MTDGPQGGSSVSFWQKEIAGLPNWVWALVLVGGIAAVYFVPKIFGKVNSATTNDSGSSQNGTAQAGTSGIGLAIDPTTGLPYAVQGLVPSGALAGSTYGSGVSQSGSSTGDTQAQLLAIIQSLINGGSGTTTLPAPPGTGTTTGAPPHPSPIPTPIAPPTPTPTPAPSFLGPPTPAPATTPRPSGQWITVASDWHLWNGTLYGIASRIYGNGSLYPRIAQANGISAPYTIYPNERIFVPA